MTDRLRSQAIVSIADQAVFSGAMLLINILLARWTTPDEYGAFAVMFSLFLILAGLHNALIVEPMSVFGPRKKPAARKVYVRHVYLMHGAVAASLAAIAALSALFLQDAALQSAKWALPLTIPLTMTFWLARRACYMESRPGHALLLSTLYAIAVTAGLYWLNRAESLTAFSALLTFGTAGFAVSLPTVVRACGHGTTAITQTFGASVRQHANYGRWSLGESIAFAFGASILPLAIAWFMTVGEAGKFRALQILFLPLTHLTTGLGLLLLPMMSRLRATGGSYQFASRAKALLLLFVALAVVYSLPLLILGREILMMIYGSAEYLDLLTLLPYFALTCVATSMTAAIMIIARSAERPDLVFFSTVAGSIAMVTLGFAMIAAFGIPGIGGALLVNSGLSAIVLAWSSRHLFYRPTPGFRRHAREGANV